MRLDFSNFEQTVTFLWSIVLGVGACLLYDILRFIHKRKMKSNTAVFFGDILYFLLQSVITFCFFMLFSKGIIRIYVYIGELLGFILCRKTLSRLFYPLLLKVDDWVMKIRDFILLPFLKISKRLSEKLRRLSEKIRIKWKNMHKKRVAKKGNTAEKNKKIKKVKKSSKKLLKLQ